MTPTLSVRAARASGTLRAEWTTDAHARRPVGMCDVRWRPQKPIVLSTISFLCAHRSRLRCVILHACQWPTVRRRARAELVSCRRRSLRTHSCTPCSSGWHTCSADDNGGKVKLAHPVATSVQLSHPPDCSTMQSITSPSSMSKSLGVCCGLMRSPSNRKRTCDKRAGSCNQWAAR